MVKAFLFDYDGVMTKAVRDGTLGERLSQNFGVPEQQAVSWLQAIWPPFVRAQITEDEVWAYIEAEYGEPISTEQRNIWLRWGELTPLPEMLELVQMLKAKGYPVGVVSNATIPTAQIIQ